MLPKDEYPELSDFLGANYHQDWVISAPTIAAVVEREARRLSADAKLELTTELDRLLAAPATEADYGHYLEAAGCSIVPEAEGFTAHTFLVMVRDVLNRS